MSEIGGEGCPTIGGVRVPLRGGYAPCAALALVVLLGACGGGGRGEPPDRAAFRSDVAAAIALEDRLSGLPATRGADVPRAGQATFAGYGGIVLEGAAPMFVIGDAALAADFGAGTLVGSVTNLRGIPIDPATDPETLNPATLDPGSLHLYEGRLDLAAGTIGGGAGPAALAAEIGGRFAGSGTAVTLDGRVSGSFRGNPMAGLVAEGGGEARVNGVRVPASITIAAGN